MISPTYLYIEKKKRKKNHSEARGRDLRDFHLLADVGSFGDGLASPYSPAFVLDTEEDESSCDAVLYQTIVAGRSVALARPVAFEEHGGINVVEIRYELAVFVIPAAEAQSGTLAIL